MAIDLDQAFAFAGQHRQGVLATLKRDGRPQMSNILYLARERYAVRISVTDGRAKTKNLRREPRASLHVIRGDFFAYVVLEGTAALSEVAEAVDDPVVEELVAMYRAAQGEHPDWDEFRQVMVADRRLVATLTVSGAYGMLGG
jgi:PPOX class probable F420-dependent enzyme